MTEITATVRDGVIVPHEPINWPDGTELRIVSVEGDDERPDWPEEFEIARWLDDGGERPAELKVDDDQPDSPEEIARWLAEFRSIPPLQMTAEEEAEWVAARKAQHDFDAAGAEARHERLRKAIEG